jgi:hypothetical protein
MPAEQFERACTSAFEAGVTGAVALLADGYDLGSTREDIEAFVAEARAWAKQRHPDSTTWLNDG